MIWIVAAYLIICIPAFWVISKDTPYLPLIQRIGWALACPVLIIIGLIRGKS